MWLCFLGPFFFLVYGFANWAAAQRSSVGSFFFDWERAIPVLPWMVIPYMSIDLFFAGALFVCSDRGELRTHVKRVVFAILVSALGFLLFPLAFAFPRPEVDGLLGAIFGVLHGLDQPYNQAPSLHISLLILLWAVYGRHLRGWLGWAAHIWFALTAASVLFTYQHHFIDIPTGALVGVTALYLFPGRQAEAPLVPFRPTRVHRTIALRYALLAALLTGGSALWPPAAPALLWGALAVALVALGYIWLGPAVFRKHDGRMSGAAILLLAPYLLGTELSFRWFCRRDDPYGEVVPGLLVGRRLNPREASTAVAAQGIATVVDLTAEFSETEVFRDLCYFNLPILDLTPPTPDELCVVCRFIDNRIGTGPVYLHCALGYSRSAIAAAAYLLYAGCAESAEQAVELLRRARPKAVLTDAHVAALRAVLPGVSDERFGELQPCAAR